jgi:hypothetical protein
MVSRVVSCSAAASAMVAHGRRAARRRLRAGLGEIAVVGLIVFEKKIGGGVRMIAVARTDEPSNTD